jgi:hypothetical protein
MPQSPHGPQFSDYDEFDTRKEAEDHVKDWKSLITSYEIKEIEDSTEEQKEELTIEELERLQWFVETSDWYNLSDNGTSKALDAKLTRIISRMRKET